MTHDETPGRSDVLRGLAGSPGVAVGRAVVVGSQKATHRHRMVAPSEISSEIARYNEAVERAQQDLREMATLVGDRRAETSIL